MGTDNAGRSRQNNDDTGADAGPVAADRPVVHGTARSPQELRAEIDELQDPDRRRVEEIRAEVAETAEELSARLDVPARLQASKDQVAAKLRERCNRVRASMTERTSAAGKAARDHPTVATGAVAVLILLVVGLSRSVSRRSRAAR
jgi:hypothetical protein